MKILIIDGQGGKLGKQLCESVLQRFEQVQIVAIGTNAMATSAMMKSGVNLCATGENAVVVNSRDADIIVGPIGIVIADSMLGEVTQKMALAVSQSSAVRILLPSNRCNNLVAGVKGVTVSDMINDALDKMQEEISRKVQ